ncbi:transcription initiation factor TFIID subunit 5-like [Drosophila pseudoobscura]|uniref:Transcription initiation factor TFIID subunit 5-like n=1 Tax=Drosophila pseudoobscura pseudoobscura TaxID=46245 RepID=A0A6I8WAW6_DROPS|nr:transcription initiation factor TFIID subunit 5-like [Drosophila pseudoobscura]
MRGPYPSWVDDSYKRRIENLKRIRTPEDLPERAQELLSGADTVEIFMARSTLNQFKMMPQERIHLDRPLPAPFAWASVDAIPDWPFDRNKLPNLSTYIVEPMNIDDDVTCATLSEDHCSVAFGTASGMVHIVAVNKDWLRMNTLRREKLFTAHQEPGCYFATASNDNVARVWRVDPAEHVVSFFGHLARLEVCLFHPNGKYLATGSADAIARIWDCDKRTQMRLCRGHKAPPQGYLVSGGRDDLIIVWDTTTERITCSLTQPNARIASIDFSYCNNLLVVWSQDCHLSLWEFQLIVKCPEKKVSSTQSTKASELALISTIQACKNGIFLQSGFVSCDALIVIWTMSSRKVIELSPKAAEKKTALVKAL